MNKSTLFLREFTKQLILNSSPKQYVKEIEEELKKPATPKINISPKITFKSKIKPVISTRPSLRTPYIIQQRPKIYPRPPISPWKPQTSPQKAEEITPEFQPEAIPTKIPEFQKINQFIANPKISLIECPGENNQVRVGVFGVKKLTQVSLSQEEMKKIVNRFSKDTKLPLLEGTFKAVAHNLIITANISKRGKILNFIITKVPAPRPPTYTTSTSSLSNTYKR